MASNSPPGITAMGRWPTFTRTWVSSKSKIRRAPRAPNTTSRWRTRSMPSAEGPASLTCTTLKRAAGSSSRALIRRPGPVAWTVRAARGASAWAVLDRVMVRAGLAPPRRAR